MKRLISLAMVIILCLSFSISSYAVTGVVTLTQNLEEADVDVYGLYEEKKESNYDTDVFEDDEAHVDIDDLEIDVVIDDYDGYEGFVRLVIVLIDEDDGQIYLDFEDMYGEDYAEFYAFDIFFVDENYEVIQANLTFTVTFTNLSELTTIPDFDYVDDDFNAYDYPAIKTSNSLTFTSNVTGFYVVAYDAPVEEETIPETEPETEPEDVTEEQTQQDEEVETTTEEVVEETTEEVTEQVTEEETTKSSSFLDTVIKTGDTNLALYALIILIASTTIAVVVLKLNKTGKKNKG